MVLAISLTALGTGSTPVTLSEVKLRSGVNQDIPQLPPGDGVVNIGYPPITYVAPTYTSGNCDGHDFGYDAFTGISAGVSAVQAGGTVNMNNATYNETVNVTKNLTLTGVANPTIQNLTINTPAVAVGGSFQVSNVLTLTSGVVTTGSNTITITNDQPGGVVITGGAITGGICRSIQAGNTGQYLFTNRYTKITPSAGQPTSTVCVVSHPNTYPPAAPAGRAMNRYYTITTSPANLSAALLWLEFLPPENINSIPDLNWSTFRRQGSSPWGQIGGVPDAAHSCIWVGGISSWSDWTIGDGANPLPITLTSFTGRLTGGSRVLLQWATASEINNYGFEVQKKIGAVAEYETVRNSFIPGHGTTNEPQLYEFTDVQAASGRWLYRLKQMDFDQTIHYTEPVTIEIPTSVADLPAAREFALEQNYPNPFNPSTTISFSIPKATFVTLEVFNTLGEKVATLLSQEMSAGRHVREWKADREASGVYIVRITSREFAASQKALLSK